MATKPAEELVAGALKYQTWVLKVSIHCEGCKRKVKKVLQSIEGIYAITIDPQQHKVTVTGNVEADTLLKKLLKSNKQAELWPEPKKKKKSMKNKEKGEADGENADEANNQQADVNGGDDDCDGESDKEEGNQTNEGGGEQTVAVVGSGASTGTKKKKKKNKKKGPNGNPPNGSAGTPIDQHHGDALPPGANVPLLMFGSDMSQPNLGSPIQHMYPGPYLPPMYYQPPPASYGLSNLSYSTMYPSSSASYFTPAMHDSTYYDPDIYLPIDTIDDSYTDDDDDETGCYIM